MIAGRGADVKREPAAPVWRGAGTGWEQVSDPFRPRLPGATWLRRIAKPIQRGGRERYKSQRVSVRSPLGKRLDYHYFFAH